MSKGQTLRVLVTERLAAAVEDIFTLFDRTIAEYETELSLYKEENQKKQSLLDTVLNPTVQLHKVGSKAPYLCSDQNQEITQNLQIKEEAEERCVIQKEEEEEEEHVPEFLFFVKTEPSVLHKAQGEEDFSPQLHLPHHSSDTDEDKNLASSFKSTLAQIPTEAKGNNYNQIHIRDTAQNSDISPKDLSAQQTSATANKKRTRTDKTSPGSAKTFQCSICQKVFLRKTTLKIHYSVHSGERPFSCPFCNKTFTLKCTLDIHKRIHTGEKPYSCFICQKAFTQKSHLDVHEKRHTGEKPFKCPTCNKAFVNRSLLNSHAKSHTGENCFSCVICGKRFATNCYLKTHMRIHTGERPYSCSFCDKTFYSNNMYNQHLKRHTGKTSARGHVTVARVSQDT